MIMSYDRPVDVEVEHGDDLVRCLSKPVYKSETNQTQIYEERHYLLGARARSVRQRGVEEGASLPQGKWPDTQNWSSAANTAEHDTHALRAASFSATQNLVHLVVGITPDFHTRYFYASG
jgi:hypothetical protein